MDGPTYLLIRSCPHLQSSIAFVPFVLVDHGELHCASRALGPFLQQLVTNSIPHPRMYYGAAPLSLFRKPPQTRTMSISHCRSTPCDSFYSLTEISFPPGLGRCPPFWLRPQPRLTTSSAAWCESADVSRIDAPRWPNSTPWGMADWGVVAIPTLASNSSPVLTKGAVLCREISSPTLASRPRT